MIQESQGSGRELEHLRELFHKAPAAHRGSRPASGRRVLVADDNRDAAESMAMLLKFAGCSVDVTFDGASALKLVERLRPQIVLLDIGMPEMDGYEVARRIRAMPHGKEIVLVALTGWGQEEDRRRASAAGFDEHLTKPVDPALLDTLLALEAPAGR
jgi:CheY-like chemotaxis protein